MNSEARWRCHHCQQKFLLRNILRHFWSCKKREKCLPRWAGYNYNPKEWDRRIREHDKIEKKIEKVYGSK